MATRKTLRKFGSNVHIIEMDARYRLDITEGISGKFEKLSDMYGEPQIHELTWVRMNAQFFGGSTRGYGSFIDPTDTLLDKPSSPGYSDLTCKNGKLLMGSGGDWTIGTSYSLITGGRIDYKHEDWHKKLMLERHPRSMAGSLCNGNNALVVVDGRLKNFSLGMTAVQQAQFGVECGFAELVNFDGGGSSTLILGDKILNSPSDGHERAIVSAIVAYRKYTMAELPVLRRGSKGMYVNLLQRLLGIASDGKFGLGTMAAVQAFQRKKYLEDDGVVGAKTWAKILKERGVVC
jgi:peptidoglycan hydrolase-like protein with peptidoglycan-binding domain